MPMAFLLLLLLLIFPILLLILSFLTRPHLTIIPIKSRHVFITGGSSGIGLALALKAASLGARLSLLARDPTKLALARDAIRLATGVEASIHAADVRDPDAIRKAIAEADPIDVLVCSHGVFWAKELAEQPVDDVGFVLDVNVVGTFRVVKEALTKMRVGDGAPRSIAIVSSQAGQVGIYGYTAYSASKFAVRGFAEALQQEVVEDNIRLSLIFPPDTDTPGLAEENKFKPELTSIIAGASTAMKADEVAEKALNGIRSGKFTISCNFEGIILSIATAGFSPQSSCLGALYEVLGASFMRFLGLWFLWDWYNSVEKYHVKNKTK